MTQWLVIYKQKMENISSNIFLYDIDAVSGQFKALFLYLCLTSFSWNYHRVDCRTDILGVLKYYFQKKISVIII